MKKYIYPIPDTAIYTKYPRPSVFSEYECGIARVKVTSPQKEIRPYLLTTIKGRLCGPVGTWTDSYTFFELREALKLGYTINKIYWSYTYEDTWSPFKDFVDYFYNKRKEYKKQNSPLEQFCKITLNSLYGRFGMKPFGHRAVRHADILELKRADNKICRKDCNHIRCYDKKGFIEDRAGEHDEWRYFIKEDFKDKDVQPGHMPSIATHVTAYARHELYKHMQKVRVIYCDTDSVFTPDKIETGKELGEMKKEYETNNAIFIRPKLYMISNKAVKGKGMKGWNKPERLKESMREFMAMVTGELTIVKSWRFMKFFGANRKYKGKFHKPNQKIDTEKKLDLEDTKRIWSKKFKYDEIQTSKPIKLKCHTKKI